MKHHLVGFISVENRPELAKFRYINFCWEIFHLTKNTENVVSNFWLAPIRHKQNKWVRFLTILLLVLLVSYTPLKFNSFAPEKRWLEDDPPLLGPGKLYTLNFQVVKSTP